MPISGRHLEKGRRYRLEVKGDMREPYSETLVVSRGGVHAVKARLAKITMRVPAGFRAAPGTEPEPYTNTGWAKEVIHERTGIEMVFIPAGEFMMGSPSGESGRDDDEGPRHRVRITKPFYLGKYEVTQRQWQRVMGSNPSHFKGDRNPVENVSWNDCREFLSHAGDGLRLPSEAEWEYACRAGTHSPYSWGETWEPSRCMAENNVGSDADSGVAYYREHGLPVGSTAPVGSFDPNPWGLYDMPGNVWEWCWDWYDSGYYARSPGSDPQGPSSRSSRVLRGGSWDHGSGRCRCAYRHYGMPNYADDYVGFRAARTCE